MTDYTTALAAAREAHTYVKHRGMTRAEAALGDLLAAIDAARGEAVAFLYTLEYGSSVADRKASTYRLNYPFGVCGADYKRSNEDGVSYVRETPLYAAPPAAAVSVRDESPVYVCEGLTVPVWTVQYANELGAYFKAQNSGFWAIGPIQSRYGEPQQPAAAVPADNVTPMRQPRADLARLVDVISAAVYANGDGLSVTEAIGALELAKLELLKEQEQ